MSRRFDIVFILGCDRTGTHLCAQFCEGPGTAVLTEGEPVFDRAIAMARNPAVIDDLWSDMIAYYGVQIDGHRPKLFVDKSHPLIWRAEMLRWEFPNAGFIFTHRNVYDTVASMMRHEGCQVDLLWSRCYPVPNRFMGIENEDWFHESMAYRLAKKWQSHSRRIAELGEWLDRDSVTLVRYEDMIGEPYRTSGELTKFLGAGDLNIPKIEETKKNVLIEQDVAAIDRAIAEG